LPAILITTNPNAIIRNRAITEGVTLVEKPLLSEALYQTVRSMLNIPVGR
jgi:flagellar biosynthesis protein FlhB